MLSYYNLFIYYFFLLILVLSIVQLILDLVYNGANAYKGKVKFDASNFYKSIVGGQPYSLMDFLCDWVYIQVILSPFFLTILLKIFVGLTLLYFTWYLPLLSLITTFLCFLFLSFKLLWCFLRGVDLTIEISFGNRQIFNASFSTLPLYFFLNSLYWAKILLYTLFIPVKKLSRYEFSAFVWVFLIGKPLWFLKHIFWLTEFLFTIVNNPIWRRKSFKLYPFLFFKKLFENLRYLFVLKLANLSLSFSGSKIILKDGVIKLNPWDQLKVKLKSLKSIDEVCILKSWFTIKSDDGTLHQVLGDWSWDYGVVYTHADSILVKNYTPHFTKLTKKLEIGELTKQEQVEYYKEIEKAETLRYASLKISNNFFEKQYVTFSFFGTDIHKGAGFLPSIIQERGLSTIESFVGLTLRINLLNLLTIKDDILFQRAHEKEILTWKINFRVAKLSGLASYDYKFKENLETFIKANALTEVDVQEIQDLKSILKEVKSAKDVELFTMFKDSKIPGFDEFLQENKDFFDKHIV